MRDSRNDIRDPTTPSFNLIGHEQAAVENQVEDKISCVIGIDVGGARKGYHAVLMIGTDIDDYHTSRDAKKLAKWCLDHEPAAIGIDAPCKWSSNGRARTAERKLMTEGTCCFSTPTEAKARNHPTNHFEWMINGMRLYRALAKDYPLYSGSWSPRLCFETFPHAIACALRDGPENVEPGATFRRGLLSKLEITSLEKLRNIDFIDAALCAFAARYFALKKVRQYGHRDDGFIVVPEVPG